MKDAKAYGKVPAIATYVIVTTLYLFVASKFASFALGAAIIWLAFMVSVWLLNSHARLWGPQNTTVNTVESLRPGLIVASVLLCLTAGLATACLAGNESAPFLIPGLAGLVILMLLPKSVWRITTRDPAGWNPT